MLFLHLNFSSIFHLFRHCLHFRLVEEFILRPFFRWFFFAVEGGSGPLKFFLGGLQGAAWGPKVCEGCRFFAFLRVVVDIVFGPQKPPKIGPLKLLNKVKFRFYSLLEIFKKFKRPTWASRGPREASPRGQKSIKKRSKNMLISRRHLGPQNGSKMVQKT